MKTTATLLALAVVTYTSVATAGGTSAADQSYQEELAQEKALKEGKTWTK